MMRTRVLTAAFLGCTLASFAQASFHFMQIEQVIGGVNGDTTAQAIQLRMRSPAQNQMQFSRLIVRDAAGLNPILLVDMAAAVPNGATGARVLIATPAFAKYTSPAVVPNFTMVRIPESYLAAGSLTFESDPPGPIIYWRLSWGGAGYTGPGTGSTTNDADGNFNPPFAGPCPSTTLQALRFTGAANAFSTNNAAQYALTLGAAVFNNNAGAAFTVVATANGACCFGDGSCDVLTSANCTTAGGDYQGNGAPCSPNPCETVLEACCLTDGTCLEVETADCLAQGGTPQGAGTNCETVECPQPPEACCFPDGTCTEIDPTTCRNTGGQSNGPGSACAGDADANGTDDACEVPVPAATISGAVSRKFCDLSLIPPRRSESRQGGVTQVHISFDVPPGGPGPNPVSLEQATCAAPVFVPYSGASSTSASIIGNELILLFSPGLENARSYRISVGPDVTTIPGQTVEVRGLVADVNSDGSVNATDRSVVVSAWTGAGFSCPTDLNNDDVTNATDRSVVVSAWTGGPATNCAP